MNQMNTKYVLPAMVLCAALLSSCQDETSAGRADTVMTIAPTLKTAETRSAVHDGFTPKKNWEQGDKMGIFLYQHTGWGDPYQFSVSQNMPSAFQANQWKQDTPIYLNMMKATVWTYYPYSAEVTDGTAIPVPIGRDNPVDYMWGKSVNDVSAVDTKADIPMNHALSQFVLRLKIAKEYAKEGKLTAIKLEASKPTFALDGTMDLSRNGAISFKPELKELSWTPAEYEAGKDLDFAATVYPMELSEGQLTLEVVLDGDTWRFPIPAVKWAAGKRHIYTVTAKFNDFVLGNESGSPVTIKPWDDTNIDMELEGK